MASADSLAGTYAMLYAVGRGSAGFVQGVIVSVQQLGSSLFQPLWGTLSDRFGRKPFMVLGLIFQFLSWGILLPWASSPLEVLGVFVFQTVLGTMLIPAWNAWIGDYTVRSNRGRMMGRLGMIGSFSSLFVLGLVSLYMQFVDPDRLDVGTYVFAFRIAGVFYILATLMVLFLPDGRNRLNGKTFSMSTLTPAGTMVRLRLGFRKGFRRRFRDRLTLVDSRFKRLVLIEGIFRFSWAIAWPIFPYATLSSTRGWLEIALLQIGVGVASGFSQLYGGSLSDRLGRKVIIRWSRLALVLPPVLVSLSVYTGSLVYFLLSNIIVGLTLGGGTIALNSMILDTAPEGRESTYFSTFLMIMGVIAFIASLIMGIILESMTGGEVPPNNVVIGLLLFAAGLRLVSWFAYVFLPDA